MTRFIAVFFAVFFASGLCAELIPNQEQCNEAEGLIEQILNTKTTDYKAKKRSVQQYIQDHEQLLKETNIPAERYVLFSRIGDLCVKAENYTKACDIIQKTEFEFPAFDEARALGDLFTKAFKSVKSTKANALRQAYAKTYEYYLEFLDFEMCEVLDKAFKPYAKKYARNTDIKNCLARQNEFLKYRKRTRSNTVINA